MTPPPQSPAERAAVEIDLARSVEARDRGVGHLGPALAWAIAFADLGTSIYYVPGILYAQVGPLAAAFVLVTTAAFVLVAMEHLEVAHRYPAGGGGVAAAVEAFGARVGVVSGALMVSAYFIAIALCVVTAMKYLAALHLPFPNEVVVLSAAAITFLGFGSFVGIKLTARLALVAGVAALLTHAALLTAVLTKLPASALLATLQNTRRLADLSWSEASSGVAAAWIAYSGLESLGQLAPSVREPRRRVIRVATVLLVASVLFTVPVFTALAVQEAALDSGAHRGALLAAVASNYGGRGLQIAVALSGAALLLLAAKVAFLGCYNVFAAIGEHGYLPAAIAKTHAADRPPMGAVLLVTLGALALVIATKGDPQVLAQLFAFGLLGSYTITSVSLDALRWRERRRGFAFVLGLLASVALAVPWVTSWFSKPTSAVYGAAVSGALLLVALVTHRGWIRSGRFGFLSAAAAERSAADLISAVEVLTLNEAIAVKQSYPSTTLLALHSRNPALCKEAARRARGMGDSAVYVVFVDEVPGFLFPPRRGPSKTALRVLRELAADLRAAGIDAVPIWRLAHDAGASLAEAAEALGVTSVFIGTAQRSTIWHFLQGSVLKRLIAELPEKVHVVICE